MGERGLLWFGGSHIFAQGFVPQSFSRLWHAVVLELNDPKNFGSEKQPGITYLSPIINPFAEGFSTIIHQEQNLLLAKGYVEEEENEAPIADAVMKVESSAF